MAIANTARTIEQDEANPHPSMHMSLTRMLLALEEDSNLGWDGTASSEAGLSAGVYLT